jgi:hypothetical protein
MSRLWWYMAPAASRRPCACSRSPIVFILPRGKKRRDQRDARSPGVYIRRRICKVFPVYSRGTSKITCRPRRACPSRPRYAVAPPGYLQGITKINPGSFGR